MDDDPEYGEREQELRAAQLKLAAVTINAVRGHVGEGKARLKRRLIDASIEMTIESDRKQHLGPRHHGHEEPLRDGLLRPTRFTG